MDTEGLFKWSEHNQISVFKCFLLMRRCVRHLKKWQSLLKKMNEARISHVADTKVMRVLKEMGAPGLTYWHTCLIMKIFKHIQK